MSDPTATKTETRIPRHSLSRALVLGLVLTLSLVAALLLQQPWWTLFLLVEVILAAGAVELLARNLPKRLRRQIKINSRRSDGSKSLRRLAIEQVSIRRFKIDTLICFAFTLIPMHACWLTYCFFLPQIVRFNETVEFSKKDQWMEILLEPAVHILLLFVVFLALMFGSLKGIYIRTLKELDDVVSRRAENYAVYDLVNPPTDKASRAKSA